MSIIEQLKQRQDNLRLINHPDRKKLILTKNDLIIESLNVFSKNVWSDPHKKWKTIKEPGWAIEIMIRLMNGLAEWQPNEKKRWEHIKSNMVYTYIWNDNLLITTRHALYGDFEEHGNVIYVLLDDIIKGDVNMEFDVIVGNPPYQNGKDLKFYWKFIEAEKKVVNDNGSILYISPKSWLCISKQYKEIINLSGFGISYLNLDERLKNYFPDISSSFCIYHIVRKNVEKTKIITFDGEEKEMDLSTFKGDIREKYIFNTKIDKIFSKLYKNGKICPEVGKGQNDFVDEKDEKNGYVFPVYLSSDKNRKTMWANKRQKGQNSMKLIVTHIMSPGKSSQFSEISFKKGVGRYSFFYRTKNKEVAENIQKFFDTKTYKFIDKIKRYGRYAYLELPNLDFSKEWTDEELYDYFDLTPDEIDLIEKNV